MNLSCRNALAGLVLAIPALVQAAPIVFDLKDPKKVNNVVFQLDALLESINGTASGISGSITYDPGQPATLTGRVVVEVASLHADNPGLQGAMHGRLQKDTYPEITFTIAKFGNLQIQGNEVLGEVSGEMTLHGVTRTITAPLRLTYLKDKLRARNGPVSPQEGDLLVARSNFMLRLSDYGIDITGESQKIANEVNITFSLAGAAPRPEPAK